MRVVQRRTSVERHLLATASRFRLVLARPTHCWRSWAPAAWRACLFGRACTTTWFRHRHGARLVVVTKGPERERLARLLELAPAGLELVMSTRAWADFGVPSTPHFVLVREGQIAGRGSATSWQQITAFLTDADDDDRLHRARMLDTDARAARAERALAEAGIGPDHPSLYPSQRGPAQHSAVADRITAAGLTGDPPPLQSHD